MRYVHTYHSSNPRHTPMQSETFVDRAQAITWAAKAAQSTGCHSEVFCTTTSMPDAEYGDRLLDVQVNVIGKVLPGADKMLTKFDVGYPAW